MAEYDVFVAGPSFSSHEQCIHFESVNFLPKRTNLARPMGRRFPYTVYSEK